MKKIVSISAMLLAAVLVFVACTKVEDLPYYENGTAVTLTASKATITATPADSSTAVIGFSWTSPKYATDTSNYKYILEFDSTGRNFTRPGSKIVTGTLSTTLTGKELNSILLDYGFTVGTAYNLDFRVVSSYGNNNERLLSNVVKLQVTPYADPSVLTTSATTVTGTLINASVKALTFSWTRSFSGYSGIVNYVIQYDSAGKNFASPQDVVAGAGVFTRDMTQGEINQTALNEGIKGGDSGRIQYRIKAVTALGATVYSNPVSVMIYTYVPLLRFYMPGSYQTATGNGTDWTPLDAPEFVRDLRTNGQLNRLYYMYVFLPANAEFKITPARNWNTSYGGVSNNLSTSGGNLKVTAAGNYRISIDVVNMKYDIREGRMGVVGDATAAGWTPGPSAVFPNQALGLARTNLFVGLQNFTTAGWKFIDNDTWDNGSSAVDETRGYASTGPSGSSLVVNNGNMPSFTTAGRYRVIWDGRDVNNVKYETSPGAEMRVVGDGMNQVGVNDWDPPSSPQMTYVGNGVWTITIALKANKSIKFLAGNAWGAFDYEDQSGSTTLGTPRKISWNSGGNDFKTPTTAGTYTITLNENAQTVTIN
jgi:starch-binding outer membrane protein SusE/F